MRKRLVIGNWKMYINDRDTAVDYARTLKRKVRAMAGVDSALAVPAPFVEAVADTLKSSTVRVGGQHLSGKEGAHTGDVSGAMLRSVGASFVIVGHSERRAMGETNADVHAGLVAAAHAGLMPVLCVGELERTEDGAHISFVAEQLRVALAGAQSMMSKLVVAYEPVWAIGKRFESAMQPPEVREMAIFIRKTLAEVLDRSHALKVPILYGGSVEPENARALIEEGDISGFLVGHASADVEQFVQILDACKK